MVEEGITVTVRDKNAVEWIRNKVRSGLSSIAVTKDDSSSNLLNAFWG